MISAELARKALRAVKDPELGLNIIDIGLIYDLDIDEAGVVHVTMTLTSPGCPVGAEIMADVRQTLAELEGVTSVDLELVWEPPWTPALMSESARGFFGWNS